MGADRPVDLAVLSNRGPLSFTHDDDGELVARRAAGGLVTTLGPGVEQHRRPVAGDRRQRRRPRGGRRTGWSRPRASGCGRCVIDQQRYRAYYDVIANGTLWFLHHGLWDLPRRPRFDRHWWEAWAAYTEVNHQFAEAAADSVAEGGTVLIQDYHLSLVGAELARLRPDLRTAAFVHTPFCIPRSCAPCPTRWPRRSSTAWPAPALRLPLRPVGVGVQRLLRRGPGPGARRPSSPRPRPTPTI